METLSAHVKAREVHGWGMRTLDMQDGSCRRSGLDPEGAVRVDGGLEAGFDEEPVAWEV